MMVCAENWTVTGGVKTFRSFWLGTTVATKILFGENTWPEVPIARPKYSLHLAESKTRNKQLHFQLKAMVTAGGRSTVSAPAQFIMGEGVATLR